MKKKAAKKLTTDREFAVILERVHTEIKAISEGQSALRDKLDSTMGMVAKNAEGISWLKILNSGIKDDIGKINGKLAKIEDDLRLIKERVNVLEETIK